MAVLFAIAGVLVDLLIETIAVFAAGAFVAGCARGVGLDDLAPMAACLACAALGLALLVRRILAGTRTLTIARAGSEAVSTISVGHLLADFVCILTTAALLVATRTPVWDDASRAGAATMLLACVALAALRVHRRVRGG